MTSILSPAFGLPGVGDPCGGNTTRARRDSWSIVYCTCSSTVPTCIITTNVPISQWNTSSKKTLQPCFFSQRLCYFEHLHKIMQVRRTSLLNEGGQSVSQVFQVLQIGPAAAAPYLDSGKSFLQLPVQFSELNRVPTIQLCSLLKLSMALSRCITFQLSNACHPFGRLHIPAALRRK